jgi:hypothetical protein
MPLELGFRSFLVSVEVFLYGASEDIGPVVNRICRVSGVSFYRYGEGAVLLGPRLGGGSL